jgi:hypothetical protein
MVTRREDLGDADWPVGWWADIRDVQLRTWGFVLARDEEMIRVRLDSSPEEPVWIPLASIVQSYRHVGGDT